MDSAAQLTHKRRNAEAFDGVAGRYDLMTALNPGYRKHLRWSAERLSAPPRGRLLDLCCGTGLSTAALAATYPNARIVALDASAGMLEVARRKPALAHVQLVEGDATDPVVAGVTGSFDGILMAYGIRNVPDRDRCLDNLLELLVPGGSLCIHEYSVSDAQTSRLIWRAVTRGVVIPLGRLTSPGSDIYRYLERSVLEFDGVRAFEARLRQAGFVDVRSATMDGWQRGIVHSFLARRPGRRTAATSRRAVVVGGGLAGVAAATVLAERGVSVTLVEREQRLGGRLAAWSTRLATGDTVEMERGFHAFFRNYHNVRALLRRVDPDLGHLVPLEDYPILGPDGALASFVGLPTETPWNVVELVRRSPWLRARDLAGVNVRQALEMLRFERGRTYARFDDLTAKAYLDSLRFPPRARQMLFDVFAHSFFNPEEGMSAAELLMMFHFYFMRNPDGLVFDVLDAPFSTAVWEPFGRYLKALGVDVRLGSAAAYLGHSGSGWDVVLEDGETLSAEGVVLAVTVPALNAIVEASSTLDDPAWRERIGGLSLTRRFAVWRLWLDGPLKSSRPPFAGTTGLGPLDNISLYHLFQDESRRWSERTGGAVVELHAYAVSDEVSETALREALWSGLLAAYPEVAELGILDERFLLRRDCPAFPPGSDACRPGVRTPFDGLTLAGDLVRLEVPSALMERAVVSGFLAANEQLERLGLPAEPVRRPQTRGLLAGRRRGVGSAS